MLRGLLLPPPPPPPPASSSALSSSARPALSIYKGAHRQPAALTLRRSHRQRADNSAAECDACIMMPPPCKENQLRRCLLSSPPFPFFRVPPPPRSAFDVVARRKERYCGAQGNRPRACPGAQRKGGPLRARGRARDVPRCDSARRRRSTKTNKTSRKHDWQRTSRD